MIALLSGAVIGYFVGAMPGLTPTIGIALLIPFTYSMDPVPSVVMLVALYMAAEYGGGITAILINTPGTPAAAATALDGYPLAQRGQAAKALDQYCFDDIVRNASGRYHHNFQFAGIFLSGDHGTERCSRPCWRCYCQRPQRRRFCSSAHNDRH